MKLFVSSLILFILLSQTSYPQFELNSGVTTELTSSSNGRIYNWYFQGWACGINGTVIRSTINTSSQWINVSGNGIQPGTYETEWDGTNYPSGVYFYKLITPEFIETRRMVLIK